MWFGVLGEEMLYLYPDLVTTIIGKFHPDSHILIKGKEAKVTLSYIPIRHNKIVLCLYIAKSSSNGYAKHTIPDCVDCSVNKGEAIGIVLGFENEFWHEPNRMIVFAAPSSKCIR